MPGKRRYDANGYVANRLSPYKRVKMAGVNAALKRAGLLRMSARNLNRRGLADKETGFVDLAAGSFVNNTTGTIALIATVAQGASVNQRIGKKIRLKSVQVRGTTISGSAGIFCDCAALLVYDRRPTGSLPGITDILDTATAASMNNDANSGRFVILRRWDWIMTGNSTTPATGNEAQSFDKYVPINGKQIVYKAAGTGAIGDIEEGALYFVSVGNQAAGTGASAMTIGFRTRFVDV